MPSDSYIANRLNRRGERLYRRKPLSEEVNKVINWLMMTLLLILVGSGTFFLYGMSSRAQEGYDLVQASHQNDKLETANRDLKLKVLEAQSFKNLDQSDVFAGMEKIGQNDETGKLD